MSLSSNFSEILAFIELGQYALIALNERNDNAMEQWNALWRFSFTGVRA